MQRLPEFCIANIISLTSPLDACRLAAISSLWRSAANSDIVWERFLPFDYVDILKRAVNYVEYSSMKELFFLLCESILIDFGQKIFSLKRSNGKVSFLLSPNDLSLHDEEESPSEWDVIPTSELSSEVWNDLELEGEPPAPFRFPVVAFLNYSFSIHIFGGIVNSSLSEDTYYAIRLIFRITSTSFGLHFPLEAMAAQSNLLCCKRVCLESGMSRQWRRGQLRPSTLMALFPLYEDPVFRLQVADIRDDGWMELEIGRFFCNIAFYIQLHPAEIGRLDERGLHSLLAVGGVGVGDGDGERWAAS